MQHAILTTPVNPPPESYTDFGHLADLRRQAQADPDKALSAVARQFESLFIKMMLKSMREAGFGDPYFDSSQQELYRDMFDNQISLEMARGQGIGLAEALSRQLGRYVHGSTEGGETGVPGRTSGGVQAPVMPARAAESRLPVSAANTGKAIGPEAELEWEALPDALPAAASSRRPEAADLPPFAGPDDFVQRLWPHAQAAADELGVSPRALIAQAALETGWGRHISRDAEGRSSNNLFNIKADARWDGPSVTVSTLEFRDGLPRREFARFRAYDSLADSFRDYVNFLRGNPRYERALAKADAPEAFVTELQQAGYATDPRYAEKIIDILRRDTWQMAEAGTEVTHGG